MSAGGFFQQAGLFPTLIIISDRFTRPKTPTPHYSNAPGKLLRAMNEVREPLATDKQRQGILGDLNDVTFHAYQPLPPLNDVTCYAYQPDNIAINAYQV